VDNATYLEPLAPPSHVRHVVVNGVPVIRDTEDTGARPGRFLSVG
jgi:N-acyl-D-amino-acid deacylase